jgi:hypothetical protein
MTQLFECIDGPYRGFIVTVADNDHRVEVRDLAGRLPPEWYDVDRNAPGVRSLTWTSHVGHEVAMIDESLGAASS